MNDAGKSLFAAVISGFFIGICVATIFINFKLQKEAIEKGFAEYNQTTGKWQWKENGK